MSALLPQARFAVNDCPFSATEPTLPVLDFSVCTQMLLSQDQWLRRWRFRLPPQPRADNPQRLLVREIAVVEPWRTGHVYRADCTPADADGGTATSGRDQPLLSNADAAARALVARANAKWHAPQGRRARGWGGMKTHRGRRCLAHTMAWPEVILYITPRKHSAGRRLPPSSKDAATDPDHVMAKLF